MSQKPLGLYVHWPFCQRKCPYCDFNSYVQAHVDENLWIDSLLQDMRYESHRTQAHLLCSLFIGGGTPSLITPCGVERLISHATKLWPVSSSLEITLEANPISLTSPQVQGYKTAGVNRLSLGVQSLRDDALHFLGRLHNSQQARHALSIAKAMPAVSFDMIYGRPQQSPVEWRHELEEALAVGRTGHVSLYQLTIEPHTPFYTQVQRQQWAMPKEDYRADLYAVTQEIMEAHGLPAYEISNHAKEGQKCAHNLLYWHYGDYVGVGPGAQGRLTHGKHTYSTSKVRSPGQWLRSLSTHKHATETPLTSEDVLTEVVMMGLRLRHGVSKESFRKATGKTLEEVFPKEHFTDLTSFLTVDGRLCATAKGRLCLDAVLTEVLHRALLHAS